VYTISDILSALHPSGVAYSSTGFAAVKAGGRNVTSAGWQVTLRGRIWNASSGSGEVCCRPLYTGIVLFRSLAVLDPRVGHTVDVLLHLSLSSVILTDSSTEESCPRLDVVHPGRA